MEMEPGLYQHYSGYHVVYLGIGRYKSPSGNTDLFVVYWRDDHLELRNPAEFASKVTFNGRVMPRFSKVGKD